MSIRQVFKLRGFLKKEKTTEDIYCIAESAEAAIPACSGFADGLVVLGSAPLGADWQVQSGLKLGR